MVPNANGINTGIKTPVIEVRGEYIPFYPKATLLELRMLYHRFFDRVELIKEEAHLEGYKRKHQEVIADAYSEMYKIVCDLTFRKFNEGGE